MKKQAQLLDFGTLTCALACLVELLKKLHDCGYCVGVEIFHVVRVNGNADSTGFRMHTEWCFEKMVSMLRYFGI